MVNKKRPFVSKQLYYALKNQITTNNQLSQIPKFPTGVESVVYERAVCKSTQSLSDCNISSKLLKNQPKQIKPVVKLAANVSIINAYKDRDLCMPIQSAGSPKKVSIMLILIGSIHTPN